MADILVDYRVERSVLERTPRIAGQFMRDHDEALPSRMLFQKIDKHAVSRADGIDAGNIFPVVENGRNDPPDRVGIVMPLQ